MTAAPRVTLKPKRDAAVKRRHPWIFSGGIARVDGDPPPGALVAVCDSRGRFLAWGHYSPKSQIRVRLSSWDEHNVPDTADFWRARLDTAIAGRKPLLAGGATTACRLINAESDGIPGLVVDKYGDVLVVQVLTAGAEAQRELLNDLLVHTLHPATLYERSDVDVRKKEGLPQRTGLLHGDAPPARVEVLENGVRFLVDVQTGHKTGFYLDQRENRALVRNAVERRKAPAAVLNVFSYTGGFGIYALAGGAATVTNVDASAEALRLGQDNLAANGFSGTQVENVEGDAFTILRDLRAQGRTFDVVVLDPPKFAFTKKDVQRATRGYKDINMQALHLLNDGGLLFTFSCSGAISADLFQKVIFGAALDVGRDVQIIGRMSQSSDHPISLTFPEGDYLKGLICRVVR